MVHDASLSAILVSHRLSSFLSLLYTQQRLKSKGHAEHVQHARFLQVLGQLVCRQAIREAKMSGLKQSLLGMGNPLLDVIATVDQGFLDKYKVRRPARTLETVDQILTLAGCRSR